MARSGPIGIHFVYLRLHALQSLRGLIRGLICILSRVIDDRDLPCRVR